jgi:hypothetical protein
MRLDRAVMTLFHSQQTKKNPTLQAFYIEDGAVANSGRMTTEVE